MIKILIAEPDYSKRAKEILRTLGKVEEFSGKRSDLLKIISKFDVLVVRIKYRIDEKVIERASRLKIIASSTTGLDHIDIALARKKGIKVIALKGETDFLREVWATAEHTFALMLSLLRKIPFAFEAVKKYQWRSNDFLGSELRDKTLGIVGFGRLGSLVGEMAKGFGMKVLAYDPYVPNKKISQAGVVPVTLEKLLREADIISLQVVLNKETELLIGQREFQKMKKGVFLINTSRGKIINEKALLKGLREKRIAGAALDVLWQENSSGDFLRKNPLINYAKKNQNLIITPHIGGTTRESMEKTQIFIAQKIKKLL